MAHKDCDNGEGYGGGLSSWQDWLGYGASFVERPGTMQGSAMGG
jgi:hypothetical protein